MENFLTRYRNLTVLLVAILAQLMLLAFQVKGDGEVPLIRAWAVTAVSPLASVLEATRSGVGGLARNYFLLLGARKENAEMKTELDQLRQETQYLRNELATADRAQTLAVFIKQTPSKVVAARVIGNTTGSGSQVLLIDRGASSGIQRGMGVMTSEGIVGKITKVFPGSAFMMLISDPDLAASVISQKNRVSGTVKGQGHGSSVRVEHIPIDLRVDQDEWFFTSGEDRIFPKGLRVGKALVVGTAPQREITLKASGLQNSLEEVLVIVEGIHGMIPEGSMPEAEATKQVSLLPPVLPPVLPSTPANATPESATAPLATAATDADKLTEHYRKIGTATGHRYGDSSSGAPNFNIVLDKKPAGQGSATPANP